MRIRIFVAALLLCAASAWGAAGDLTATHTIEEVASPYVALTVTVTNGGAEPLQSVTLWPRGFLAGPAGGESLDVGILAPGDAATRSLRLAPEADLRQVSPGMALPLQFLATAEGAAGAQEALIDSEPAGGTP
jgi:hypothetical protein